METIGSSATMAKNQKVARNRTYVKILQSVGEFCFTGLNNLKFVRLRKLFIYLRYYTYICTYICIYGTGTSVGIATDYGLDGPGSNPGGDEIFRPSRPALGPTQPTAKWVPGLSRGVKCGRGMLLTTHPLLVPRVMEE